jgi:probable HAF family extracellular repeat protein
VQSHLPRFVANTVPFFFAIIFLGSVVAILAGCSGSLTQVGQPPTAAAPVPQKKLYYIVQSLGSLGGSRCCAVVKNNDRGWVVGTSDLPGNKSFHAFLWINGTMKDLGTLGGPNSNVGWIDNNGGDIAVGGSDTGKPDPLGEEFCEYGTHQTCLSFVWHHGKRRLIPTLGGNNNDVGDVDNHGLVLAYGETKVRDPQCIAPQVLDYEAYTWDPQTGRIRRLAPVKGDAVSQAGPLNDRGETVGYSGACGPQFDILLTYHAVLWRGDKPIDLGNLGGTIANEASGLNNRSQVTGLSALRGNKTAHAFLWQSGTMSDLGTLPGDHLSSGGDINDAGQVAGGSCKSAADYPHKCRATIWTNGMIADLNTLVRPPSSLFLTFANSINAHGDIVGEAHDRATGALVPFLATRCDPNGVLVKACSQ